MPLIYAQEGRARGGAHLRMMAPRSLAVFLHQAGQAALAAAMAALVSLAFMWGTFAKTSLMDGLCTCACGMQACGLDTALGGALYRVPRAHDPRCHANM